MRCFLGAELKQVQGFANWLAANLVSNQASLLRRDVCAAKFCLYFHRLYPHQALTLGFLVNNVAPVSTGHCEFTQLVANHILVDQNWDMLAAVMNRDS